MAIFIILGIIGFFVGYLVIQMEPDEANRTEAMTAWWFALIIFGLICIGELISRALSPW